MDGTKSSPDWRTSSFSAQGDCVQWCVGESGVRVRHSQAPDGPELMFTKSEWAAFISGAKAGEADFQ